MFYENEHSVKNIFEKLLNNQHVRLIEDQREKRPADFL